MRLLGAELRGLLRPLTGWIAVALVLLACLVTAGGARDARRLAATAGAAAPAPGELEGLIEPPDDCAAYGLPEGAACRREIAAARAAMGDGRPEADAARALAAQLHDPVAAGWLAAGLLGSLPGAIAVLILAAGSVGGELRRRTIAPLVARAGRRLPILVAKVASLWLAGAALLLLTWAALALFTLGLRLAAASPPSMLPLAEAAGLTAGRAGRALVVLAGFAVAGVLAGVVARGGAHTVVLAGTGLAAALACLAGLPAFAVANPAGWVAAVMGFRGPVTVIDHLWVTVPPATRPGTAAGLAGLVTLGAGAWLLAVRHFERTPIRA